MFRRAVVLIIVCGLMTIGPSAAQRTTTGQISGYVTDTTGAVIARASVFVHKHSPSEDEVKLISHTDSNGEFVLTLPEGGYDILVTSPDFSAEVETVSILSGKTKKLQWKLKVVGWDFPA